MLKVLQLNENVLRPMACMERSQTLTGIHHSFLPLELNGQTKAFKSPGRGHTVIGYRHGGSYDGNNEEGKIPSDKTEQRIVLGEETVEGILWKGQGGPTREEVGPA